MDKGRKKIVMIGPVYPYKGGIAHYTSLMYRALSCKYDVRMISYSMQYPKILFKKEQRDYDNKTFQIPDTKYWINTANPFNILSVARKIRKMKPDLVIFQWWHPYFAPCYWIMEKVLAHTKKLFVCHNVFPHERFPMDRRLSSMVLKNGNCFIVQSKQDEADLLTIRRDAPHARTVHPTYNAFRLEGISRATARERLGIDAKEKVLLFFGFVREYKGLKHMIHALPEIVSAQPDVKLYIVGDFDGDKEHYLEMIREEGMESHVVIQDGYVPDREVEKYFAASDLVVLPYESATQSGIVQIAYGFELPVVATAVGGLPEVVMDGVTGYVVPPQDDSALTKAVIRFFAEDRAEEFHENVIREADRYYWEHMVEVIEGLWQK